MGFRGVMKYLLQVYMLPRSYLKTDQKNYLVSEFLSTILWLSVTLNSAFKYIEYIPRNEFDMQIQFHHYTMDLSFSGMVYFTSDEKN